MTANPVWECPEKGCTYAIGTGTDTYTLARNIHQKNHKTNPSGPRSSGGSGGGGFFGKIGDFVGDVIEGIFD